MRKSISTLRRTGKPEVICRSISGTKVGDTTADAAKIGRGDRIPNRVDIEERPAVTSGRKRYGDWEADLIQGRAGSGFLLSVYERKSRIGRLHLLPDKSSAETLKGIVTVLYGLKVDSFNSACSSPPVPARQRGTVVHPDDLRDARAAEQRA